MDDSQILSTFQELPGTARQRQQRAPQQVPVFDACQIGVVLRAVLFVEATVAAAALFSAGGWWDWLVRTAIVSGAALPATLAWLLVVCSIKRPLARWRVSRQHACGVALGALAGLYGCGMLALVGLGEQKSPWLASALAGALMAGFFGYALVLRSKLLMPAATTARLAELQARIRPHFLFNSLNSAIALVRDQPAKAEALLEDLSELFRHALVEQGDAVKLSEEIAVARHYLDIEQVRFGDRLQVEWALDPDAGDARVPPLFLQPLVENAVKHGVEPSPTGAQVKVSTQKRGGVVVIKVTNTVPGGQGSPGHGVAQDNVRDRLRLLHDVEAQFQTILKDGLYQVRMEVPA
ncbi:histidine kinase [Ramlibacter albus]|uniref:Histidine kinase n=1 Tax=Ramlibacter albus TaxID=2079448 RepID=A0A923MDG9_9BURK|nr:histidine kinase [Ramlibacter albus]MBC5768348.1 histidine kinase [Ramlibacter albus]